MIREMGWNEIVESASTIAVDQFGPIPLAMWWWSLNTFSPTKWTDTENAMSSLELSFQQKVDYMEEFVDNWMNEWNEMGMCRVAVVTIANLGTSFAGNESINGTNRYQSWWIDLNYGHAWWRLYVFGRVPLLRKRTCLDEWRSVSRCTSDKMNAAIINRPNNWSHFDGWLVSNVHV